MAGDGAKGAEGRSPATWEPAHRRAISDLILYVIFLVLFTLGTVRNLDNADAYWFGANIRGQLAGVEFLEKHAPTFGKNFEDIGTVQEVYQWMLGPMHAALFAPEATFDGNATAAQAAARRGMLLAHGKILGPVRISQYRRKRVTCSDVPSELNYTFSCYGGESKDAFGWFMDFDTSGCADDEPWYACTNRTPAAYAPHLPQVLYRPNYAGFNYGGQYGWNGHHINEDVAAARLQPLSGYRNSRHGRTYPYAGFAVLIHPNDGPAMAQRILRNLVLSNYVTEDTSALFVDFTVYNGMLDHVCAVRMAAEMPNAGGVLPTAEIEVVRLWEFHTTADKLFIVFVYVPVLLFYCYYMVREKVNFQTLGGRRYFSSFINCVQVANFIFYWTQLFCRFYLLTFLPDTFDPLGTKFIDFNRAVRFKNLAVSLQATNVFLNWFKLIQILSFSPTFGVMTATIARSAKGVAGFGMIFFIIFFGFAQSHSMVFGAKIEEFRTIGDTMFSLIRSLLGDFDFVALERADGTMGPVLFIVFVMLAVLVVLNMLIAIISDAYAECEEDNRGKEPVNVSRDTMLYLQHVLRLDAVTAVVAGRCCRRRGGGAQVAAQRAGGDAGAGGPEAGGVTPGGGVDGGG
eukprot:g6573.t1